MRLCRLRSVLRPRQRVAPEVLDVFDVLGVGLEVGDHVVVEPVCVLAERFVALQHDHRRVVGIELLEDLADAHHRGHRRCLFWGHRHRAHLANNFELRHGQVEQHDERDPAEDDRDCQPADPPGHDQSARLLGRDDAVGRRRAHQVVIR